MLPAKSDFIFIVGICIVILVKHSFIDILSQFHKLLFFILCGSPVAIPGSKKLL
jgi:hypothetical protein